MDDIRYEIDKIAYIEHILREDLLKLARCYLRSLDTEMMMFPKELKSSNISAYETPYNLTVKDFKKPVKELLPRFVNQIAQLSSSPPYDKHDCMDENRIYTYLIYYSDLIQWERRLANENDDM